MRLPRHGGWLAAACVLAAANGAPAHAALRADTPYGLHSMLYLDAPSSFKAAMFGEAAALGASSIRVDVAVPAIVIGSRGERDWSQLDEYVALARRYRLQVVGVLLGVPWWMAGCPPGTAPADAYKCPATDPEAWAAYAGEIATRARGVIDDWEIVNEPDGRWAYLGSASEYARTLIAAAARIHSASQHARVLLGGVMSLASRPWLREVLAARGAELRRAIDVVNVHVRGRLSSLGRTIRAWRGFFAQRGLRRPLWVTEHGYPSDPRYQRDPAFAFGERGQAAYLARSLASMRSAGAARVFVTERDNLGGAFASEGLVGGAVADPPRPDPLIVPKLAAGTFRRLARR